jgi:hypothetical protein
LLQFCTMENLQLMNLDLLDFYKKTENITEIFFEMWFKLL